MSWDSITFICRYEAYDAISDLPLRVGKRVRITTTNVVNLNITSANVETLVGSILAWRKQVDHEQQAHMAMQLEKVSIWDNIVSS